MIIHIYSDPGHGWAKVPVKLLWKLGITGEISPYSYIRRGHAYLEEDCDLSVLIEALNAKGTKVEFQEHVTRERRSRIRGYERYTPHRAFLSLTEYTT